MSYQDTLPEPISTGEFGSLYELTSGRRLLQIPSPPGLSEQRARVWMQAVERLIQLPHPHLATIYSVRCEEQNFWVEMNALPGSTPERNADSRQLICWATQLAAVACHLEKVRFPLDHGFPNLKHLAVNGPQLQVLDPGLGEALWLNPPSGSAVQRFGDVLRQLSGGQLPADLEWIAARCQADPALRYKDFTEVARAFSQSLAVSEPEVSRKVTPTSLPELADFQPPVLGPLKARVSKGLLGLLAVLLFSLGWALWAWLQRPGPPRNYPAAVLCRGSQLTFLDLNSGVVRRRIELPSPAVAACRMGDWLLVQCRGARKLHSFHIRTLLPGNGPLIDPDPDVMVPDRPGRRLYLLYRRRARVLQIELPQNPVAYIDVPPETEMLQPFVLDDGQPGLFVASRSPGRLQCHSVQGRIPRQRWSPPTEVDQIAVDQGDRCWVAGSGQLQEWSPKSGLVRSLPLSQKSLDLVAIGPRLVCLLPSGLAILEHPPELSLKQFPLSFEPRQLQPDPIHQEQAWIMGDSTLTCVNLEQRREVKRWTLSHPFENLTILP